MKFERHELWAVCGLVVAVLVLVYGDNWSNWHPGITSAPSKPTQEGPAEPPHTPPGSPPNAPSPKPQPTTKRTDLPPEPEPGTGGTPPPLTTGEPEPAINKCGGTKQSFAANGPVEVAFAQCGVIALSSSEGRWGVRLAGWIRNRSDATQYSTVSEMRDGQMGHAGYVAGWHGTASDGGPCEVRDLGNAALPVSGLREGQLPENAARALTGRAAQRELLAAGETKGFQVFFFCPNGIDNRLQLQGGIRFFIVEGGYWVPRDFSFEGIDITGFVRPN